MKRHDREFRPVLRILGTQPRVGPIPADQFVPWVLIVLLTYFVGQGVFNLGLIQVFAIAAWGIATWWILTGGQTWRFLARWRQAPTFCRGYLSYISLLLPAVSPKRRSKRRKSKRS